MKLFNRTGGDKRMASSTALTTRCGSPHSSDHTSLLSVTAATVFTSDAIAISTPAPIARTPIATMSARST